MSPLIRLDQRVGREPFFLGYQLALLRKEYAQSFEEQAAAFGLDPECESPRHPLPDQQMPARWPPLPPAPTFPIMSVCLFKNL